MTTGHRPRLPSGTPVKGNKIGKRFTKLSPPAKYKAKTKRKFVRVPHS